MRVKLVFDDIIKLAQNFICIYGWTTNICDDDSSQIICGDPRFFYKHMWSIVRQPQCKCLNTLIILRKQGEIKALEFNWALPIICSVNK